MSVALANLLLPHHAFGGLAYTDFSLIKFGTYIAKLNGTSCGKNFRRSTRRQLFKFHRNAQSMFRLFLIEQLRKAKKSAAGRPKLPEKQYRNRRLYERFNIDHKHLSLLNDQDILLIRDISSGGFCCEVGERCFKRLNVADAYLCRIRYLNEVFEVKASVSWKSKTFIGFAISEPSTKVQAFLDRILIPARIGTSLKTLDATLKAKSSQPLLRFHGEDQSTLVIWEEDGLEISSWYFEYQKTYIAWELLNGVETGQLVEPDKTSLASPWESQRKKDTKVDEQIRQFAIDVFMVLNFERNAELINTLRG